MNETSSIPGYRLFAGGIAMLILFALGHLAGFLTARHSARHDPDLAELTKMMREHRDSLLGFRPSILDFREYFSINFSILLILAAALGIVAYGVAQDKPLAIRSLSAAYLAVMGLLLLTSVVYSVAQGIISCFVIGVLFAAAWWRA